jgi:hypothetical protein
MVARLFHRGWFWEHETTNVNVNDESAIDNMSEEELIKRRSRPIASEPK